MLGNIFRVIMVQFIRLRGDFWFGAGFISFRHRVAADLELELALALVERLALLELPSAVAQTGLAVQGPEHSLLR